MSEKIWFITGTSRGLGRVWAEAALKRGDKVAATARNVDSLAALTQTFGSAVMPLGLDVADRAAVYTAIKQAHKHFGRLDVVVNNAGYGLIGTVEEISEEQARSQMETNFFGALWVIQAVLPILRAQKSGHILSVTSLGGIVAYPTGGVYGASKWALEGLSESLSREVADLGIKVTMIEPGSYDTDWRTSSAKHSTKMVAYDGLRAKMAPMLAARVLGNPAATATAVLAVVDSATPPLRLLLGGTALGAVEQCYADRLATWKAWEEVSKGAQGKMPG